MKRFGGRRGFRSQSYHLNWKSMREKRDLYPQVGGEKEEEIRGQRQERDLNC